MRTPPFRMSIRRRLGEQEGMTLVELMVTAAILITIMAIFLPLMASVQTGVKRQEDRSNTIDGLRDAMFQLEREIRSGSLVYDPTTEPGLPSGYQGYVLRVYTQANATTRTPPNQCIRWRIGNGKIERQSYQVTGGVATLIQGWRVVATNIVNKEVSPQVVPFSLDSSGRIIRVTLIGDSSTTDTVTSPVRMETSIAIRNSTVADPCTPVPAW